MEAKVRRLLDALADHALGGILELDRGRHVPIALVRVLLQHGEMEIVAGVDVVRDLESDGLRRPGSRDIDLARHPAGWIPAQVYRPQLFGDADELPLCVDLQRYPAAEGIAA